MIRLIEVESQNRGVYDPQALPADFGPDAQGRVREMFPLCAGEASSPRGAALAGDLRRSPVLQELDPINVEFISLAARRLGELVRADASHSRA